MYFLKLQLKTINRGLLKKEKSKMSKLTKGFSFFIIKLRVNLKNNYSRFFCSV